jgi:hypothetical protein
VDPNHEETMFDSAMDATAKEEAEIEKLNSINTVDIDNAINIMNDPVALARAAKVQYEQAVLN